MTRFDVSDDYLRVDQNQFVKLFTKIFIHIN